MTYEYTNAYFKTSDPHPQMFGDFEIPEGWWSRAHEYYWGMTYAQPPQVAYGFDTHRFISADMGCGWHYRPFHDALATVCEFVFGVDHHVEVLELPKLPNVEFVVADFSKPITEIESASLDRIFCISVLEELINYPDALAEFKRLLKPDGLIVITCDMPWKDDRHAHEKYKGVKLDELEAGMAKAGLVYHGSINRVKPDDALHNEEFNLMVWHAVLKHG